MVLKFGVFSSLYLDNCPHLLLVVSADEQSSASGLQLHDVAPQVLELVREHARPDQGLQSHVPGPHLLVLSLSVVGPDGTTKVSKFEQVLNKPDNTLNMRNN
jgi:hypothetical protein